MTRDEIRADAQTRLRWIVVGSGTAPRPEADMRAIIAWIDRAVDARFIDAECFEATMLQGLIDGMFTVGTVRGEELDFQLTDSGRAYVGSMPHRLDRLTKGGIQ